MFLRVMALVFFGAAIVTGFSIGWGTSVADALGAGSTSAVAALQSFIQTYTFRELWDGTFGLLLRLQAWLAWILLGIVFFIGSAIRMSRG